MYVIYIIDNVVANPFLAWKSAGSPQTPTPELFQQMRRFEVCWFVIAHHHSVGERTKQLDIFCHITDFTSIRFFHGALQFVAAYFHRTQQLLRTARTTSGKCVLRIFRK